MADDPRTEEKLKTRVEELEKTVKALLKGMKETENEIDEPLMPTGTYFGIEFHFVLC